MKPLSCSLVLAALIGLAVSAVTPVPPCVSPDPTNILELGCWGYKECVNGVVIKHVCANGEVFERDTMKCIPKGTGNTDCGKPSICLGKPDGLYPDIADNCETYIQCGGGIFHDRHYCPLDLVFNVALQVCDYKHHVLTPCGTLVEPTTTTS